MKLYLNQPLFSATDLLNFLGCTHTTALDIVLMRGALAAPPGEDDAYLEILKEKGLAHEGSYVEKLTREGRVLVEIRREDSVDAMAKATINAMRSGVDVIYQGALTAPGWHGYSDFLIRVDTASDFGAYSYEVADTKLSRSAKPKHVVQLCVYSEMLAREQRVRPEQAYVVLGDGTEVSVRLHDYLFYCNRARERFDLFVSGNERSTTAERCPHCKLCHWSERCEDEWENTGNLRLVAGLGASQARKLRASQITTITQLAEVNSDVTVARIQTSTLERLRSQARLQMVNRTTGEHCVEILPPLERRGFARLPQPNEGDLFFDMEGDPVFSAKGSLEYLFGFHFRENGQDLYKTFWAHNRDEERNAFENALDFITTRIDKYPNAFIYHYAAYEQTALKRLTREYGGSSRHEDALKRLAQTHGTRENELDDLLRNRKFVDLYKVVRESVMTSEPAYSLKKLEVFFTIQRKEAIKSGDESIVAFEKWLKAGDDSLLEQIEDYNNVDCLSTRLCRDWLLSLRPAETKWYDPEEEKAADEAEREKRRRDDDAFVLAMREALVAGASDEKDLEWRELLGFLLEYHRREARKEWWDFFKRLDPAYDHVADADCIGCVEVDTSHPPRAAKRSWIWRLKFPEQEFKLRAGKTPVRTDTGKSAGEIVEVNEDECWLDIKIGPSRPPFSAVTSLMPSGPINDAPMREAIRRYAQAVIDGHEADYSAVTSILRRDRPELEGSIILRAGTDLLNSTVDAVARMKKTHLVVQGPPGCGKTFTSAHAIVSLLNDGKRVGITSMSHKAINLLMQNVEDIALEQGVTFTGIKRSNEDEHQLNSDIIEEAANNDIVFDGDHQLIGATAWLFSRPELDKTLDYLFVDEAGQVSLADIVATGLSASNIVLVGDQMQLSQPTQGQHPGGSGVSGLDYLMGDWHTVPPDRGIFLERTWRMHPRLCRFVSDAFYDSRLESAECTTGQLIDIDTDAADALGRFGLKFVAVEHHDNAQRSSEEAMELDRAYRRLLGKTWVNQKREIREITIDDILVVSPYNMQVNLLKRRLPVGARVGTVDKFQGQEATVVLVSMASSSGDDAPRGIDFLFSRNRLNVALSRARCLSVIFCSPQLLDYVCADLEKMRLVNTVCWAKDYAANSN